MVDYDIVVAGGGPAGIAAAITAARAGASVALLERGSYPRQKVCGEFISAESLAVLRRLFVDTPEGVHALECAPRIERARVFVGEQRFEAQISPAAVSLARYDLDALLWKAAEKAGVTARTQAEVVGTNMTADKEMLVNTREIGCETAERPTLSRRFEPSDGGALIHGIRARAFIQAAGRSSRLAPVTSGEKWIGIKAHFRATNGAASTDLYCFDGGYCGVQPVRCGAETLVNVCALVRAGRARTIEDVLGCHDRLAQVSRGWERACDTVTIGAVAFRRPETERDGVFLAGDAAGFIDPFVGDGIAIALRSGSMAGEIAAGVGREMTIEQAHAMYAKRYHAAFDGAFRNARRLRTMLELPRVARAALIAMLRFPGAAEMVVRATRSV